MSIQDQLSPVHTIRDALTGGDRRSLGRTEEVVRWVLADPARLGELVECLFADDEMVRMRAGDGLEKVARRQPDWLVPYVERLLAEVPTIRQPSLQWHLAQIVSEIPLTADQQARAIVRLKRNLEEYDDWIVTSLTLEALAVFARRDSTLRREFPSILRNYEHSSRKSIAARARKLLREFV